MKRALAVAVVLILAAGIGMVARSDGSERGRFPAGGSADGVASMPEPMATFAGEGGGGGAPADLDAALPGPIPAGVPETSAGGGEDALAIAQSAEAGPRVVKTAAVTVRLEEGEFEGAFQDASLVASRRGGFIASSSTSKGEEFRSGTLVMRVAASQFDQALADLRKLGEVIGEQASGEDVTAHFVDLEARLRNWEAQETVLLRLMSQANTIDESIKVQRNLQDVQLEIERLRGQLRLLRDQTDMGTITLTLAEGEAIAEVTEEEESTLVRAWRDAVGGFLAVIAATVVGLGYLIPIGLLAAVGWLLYRRLRPVQLPAES